MKESINRRQFVAAGAATVGSVAVLGALGCSSGSDEETETDSEVEAPDTLVFAWEPGASEGEYENMRDLIAEAIAEGSGVECETMTTTDYNVCIEAVNSGEAHYASLGAKEYVELHAKNEACQVAWVLSDENGELNQVSYHSQILVLEDNASEYASGDSYELTQELMEGKNMSYVDLSSTSGYVIPTYSLAAEFGIEDPDDLGESGVFFDTVLFGDSHVGALYNVLCGDADFACCDDTGLANNYTVIEGENGELGTLYAVKDGLDAPLDEYAGVQFRCVMSNPVPAVPFVVNTDYVPDEMNQNVIDYMCSEAVSGNPELFKDPDDEDTVTKWEQTGKDTFIPCDDSYYDDFREMIGMA